MNQMNEILPYLEFQITDHCNLNCKGCSHFCPLATESFLGMNAFRKDIIRLAELFKDISKIRIMGGEPLLHPFITSFVRETRSAFPYSIISVVTNGILLPSMNFSFYRTLYEKNIILDVSVYPVIKEQLFSYLELPIKYKIPIRFSIAGEFCKSINALGNSNANYIHRQCWVKDCTFLRNGKLYPCCLPALSGLINQRFNLNIPDEGIDIHSNTTSTEILKYIAKPSPSCAYCDKPEWFPWALSQCQMDEWILPH